MATETKKREKKEAKEINKMLKEKKEREKEEKLESMTPEQIAKLNKNKPPVRGILEEVGNSISHGIGALLAVASLVLMLINSDGAIMIISAIIYALCMFLMFLNSCLYHAWKSNSKVKYVWRRFDYTSIYLQIGGTFTPILLVELHNLNKSLMPLGIAWCATMWTIIFFGITMTCIFGPGRIRKLNFLLYFLIGWAGLAFIPIWIYYDRVPLLLWILFGGLTYTIGIIPFAIKAKSSHFIWHIFVVLGALIQWIGIFIYIF